MRKWLLLLLASLCLALVGCDPYTSPAGVYRDDDLSFDYPAGWTVSVKPVGTSPSDKVVFARGPDNAVLVLIRVPAGSALPIRSFAEAFARKRDEKVSERGRIGSHSFMSPAPATLVASRERIGGQDVDGFRQDFTLTMFGIAIPFESHFAVIANPRRAVYVVTQNSIRHRARVQASFATMLGSLRLLPVDASAP